jgi:hypothetical protein
MKYWRNPDELLDEGSVKWIEWIKGAKKLHDEFDMAIELIEDYIPERIVFFVGLGFDRHSSSHLSVAHQRGAIRLMFLQ